MNEEAPRADMARGAFRLRGEPEASARSGLNASLLVRHPDTKQLFVNFDPQILELIQEAKYLQKLNLSVPESALFLFKKEDNKLFERKRKKHKQGRNCAQQIAKIDDKLNDLCDFTLHWWKTQQN